MSAVVSDLMKKLITEIPLVTGYSTKKRISNPYQIFDVNINSYKQLAGGWGILMGGSNRSLPAFKTLHSEQAFSIVLTRQITGSEEKPEVLDREVEALQVDAHELITHLSSNEIWAYPVGVIDVQVASTDTVEYLNDSKFKMVMTSVNFIARIEEDLD